MFFSKHHSALIKQQQKLNWNNNKNLSTLTFSMWCSIRGGLSAGLASGFDSLASFGIPQLPHCILRRATGNWRRQRWQHSTCWRALLCRAQASCLLPTSGQRMPGMAKADPPRPRSLLLLPKRVSAVCSSDLPEQAFVLFPKIFSNTVCF